MNLPFNAGEFGVPLLACQRYSDAHCGHDPAITCENRYKSVRITRLTLVEECTVCTSIIQYNITNRATEMLQGFNPLDNINNIGGMNDNQMTTVCYILDTDE